MPKFKNRTSNGCAGARTSEHLERDIIDASVGAAALGAEVHILNVVIVRARLRRRPEAAAKPASRRIGYRGVVIQRIQFSKRR